MNGWVTWVLLGGAVGLAFVVVDEVRHLDAEVPEVAVSARPARAGAGAPADETVALPPLPALDAMPQTVERPLFDSSRQPPEVAEAAPVVAAAPVAVTPPNVSLSAIVIADGEPLAIVKDASEPSSKIVRKGDAVGNWIVAAIEANPDTLTLSQGASQHSVKLWVSKPPPPPRARTPRRQPRAGQGNGTTAQAQPRRAERADPQAQSEQRLERQRRLEELRAQRRANRN